MLPWQITIATRRSALATQIRWTAAATSSIWLDATTRQRLEGEELQATAVRKTITASTSAAKQTLTRCTESHSAVAPRVLHQQQSMNEMPSAVEQNVGQTAFPPAGNIPDFQFPRVLFLK